MKVLITGGDGQLGQAFKQQWEKQGTEVLCLNKKTLNVVDEQATLNCITENEPNLVIHCAAYTAVERAEIDAARAFDVNALGSYHLAKACEKSGAKLVFISTDYVFDGKKRTPYEVTDPTNPLNIYGMSKWLGEKLALKECHDTYVVRTSWLYGHGGKNFVNTMRDKAKAGERIKVIAEQYGSPTYTCDLVDAVSWLVAKEPGIYQFSNAGICSWYEFAREIYFQAGADPDLVEPKSLQEYTSVANRPVYSVMSKARYAEQTGETPPHWKKALREFFRKEWNE